MNEPLNKDLLYGDFRDGMAKREKLALKAAYKALDIPVDDMNINANKTVNGIGAIGAVGIALAAAAIPTALAAWLALKQPEVPAPVNTNTTKGFLIDFQPKVQP